MTIVRVDQAMASALELARRGPTGPNPRVGCVVLDRSGAIAGEGWHAGTGTAHAEIVALAAAGERARGGTAVVTLEPCTHHGRTGPCVDALIDAGVDRVVYGCRDLNPVASGGADVLASAGIEAAVIGDASLRTAAADLVETWAFAIRHQRPFVTWKLATTIDGRSAARDGSSQWITGPVARTEVHLLRAECDTVLVGTGTVLADDPQLTARSEDGLLLARQPVRAIMGQRAVPPHSRALDDAARTVRLQTRDPIAALAELWQFGSRHVLLEGGPTLAASFVRAGLVDEVIAYIAPALLGAGVPAVADLGVESIDGVRRFELVEATVIGGDVRIVMRPTVPADIARPCAD